MKFSRGQQKFIIIIFTAAVSLLIIDVIITKFFIPAKSNPNNKIEKSGIELDYIFHSTLNKFEFDNNWIHEIKRRKSDDDSLYKKYKITVPKDLTIPELLVDLFIDFQSAEARLECEELNKNGETMLNIYSGKHLKIKSILSYGKEERRKCVVGIFLDNFELNNYEDSLLIGVPEPFCVIVSPSSESAENIDFIIDNNKEYALILDDNISELKFKLSSGYSENRINGSLKSIVGNFSDAICYLIDENSSVFNSQNGKFILHELERRKIKHISINKIENLDDQQGSEIKQKFVNLLMDKSENSYLEFIVAQDEFKELIPEISKQRKKGIKFLNPSQVQFYRNEKSNLSQ